MQILSAHSPRHGYWTSAAGVLFLTVGWLACSGLAEAQDQPQSQPANAGQNTTDNDSGGLDLSHYQGPGILSPGVGNLGQGGLVNGFDFSLGVSGTYDSFLQPFRTDAKGNLVRVIGLYGVEENARLYGFHQGKHYKVGLDFAGGYYQYANVSGYNNANVNLALGYTVQVARHVILDFNETGGSYIYANGGLGSSLANSGENLVPVPQIYDTRTDFVSSSVDATYLASLSTSFSVGGRMYLQAPRGTNLSRSLSLEGHGRVSHRLSKNATAGVYYAYTHVNLPSFSFTSDTHTMQAFYALVFARTWTFTLDAGASVTSTDGVSTVALDPVLAAIFGPTISFRTVNTLVYPSGQVSLRRQLKTSAYTIGYSRAISSGNGLYTTSKQQSITASYNYSGIRRWNFGLDAGYYSLASLSQDLGSYNTSAEGLTISYNLFRHVSAVARYEYRRENSDGSNLNLLSGSRVNIGLQWSPREYGLPGR